MVKPKPAPRDTLNPAQVRSPHIGASQVTAAADSLPELFSAKTLGKAFELHPKTLLRAAARGELSSYKPSKRIVRFQRSDVQAWLAAAKV